MELTETYAYTSEQPLDCPITAFGGQQDGNVTRETLAAWEDQTSDSFNLSGVVNPAQAITFSNVTPEIPQAAVQGPGLRQDDGRRNCAGENAAPEPLIRACSKINSRRFSF